LTHSTRKFLRPKLASHSKLHKFTIFLHRKYCSLTGFLHVLPDFYIIGAAKCGTSSLYDYLLQHPDVQPAFTKEPRYFDKYYDRGENWYRVCFPFKIHKYFLKTIFRRGFITGEATPRYVDHPHAPKRLKKLTPNAKLIVLLRNPIDRAYSNYNMRAEADTESLSFKDAVKQEKQRTKGEFEKMLKDGNYYSRDYYHYSYLHRSIYVDKLKRWMSIFPKEQFLFIQSEEFFKNPSEVYNKVLQFLELSPHDLKEYKKVGAAKYKKLTINPDLRKQLVEYFRPHNQRLYEFLGTDFHWDE